MNSLFKTSITALALSSALLAVPAPPERGMAMERVDLGESARAAGDVSRFLQQPKLGEAVALAKASKEATDEATRNPAEFLTKHGVMVPRNAQVKFEPSGDGGTAAKVKVEVTIRCCPLNITIVISW